MSVAIRYRRHADERIDSAFVDKGYVPSGHGPDTYEGSFYGAPIGDRHVAIGVFCGDAQVTGFDDPAILNNDIGSVTIADFGEDAGGAGRDVRTVADGDVAASRRVNADCIAIRPSARDYVAAISDRDRPTAVSEDACRHRICRSLRNRGDAAVVLDIDGGRRECSCVDSLGLSKKWSVCRGVYISSVQDTHIGVHAFRSNAERRSGRALGVKGEIAAVIDKGRTSNPRACVSIPRIYTPLPSAVASTFPAIDDGNAASGGLRGGADAATGRHISRCGQTAGIVEDDGSAVVGRRFQVNGEGMSIIRVVGAWDVSVADDLVRFV